MSIGAPSSRRFPSGARSRPSSCRRAAGRQAGRLRAAGLGTFFKNGKAAFGFGLFCVIALGAILAPVLTSADPSKFGTFPQRLHPGSAHWFGTTDYGQDIFAQVVYGARVSLLSRPRGGESRPRIATTFGLLAAYKPGIVDKHRQHGDEHLPRHPRDPLLIVVMSFIPQRGPFIICILLGVTSWAVEARILRGRRSACAAVTSSWPRR